jgi:glycosyltransferase involved in cell wall biosynthesis
VPVVTTAILGVEPELAAVTAQLRDETPAGLAALLRELAALPPEERQALGGRARQLVLREKSWAAQGRKLAALLLGVARAG